MIIAESNQWVSLSNEVEYVATPLGVDTWLGCNGEHLLLQLFVSTVVGHAAFGALCISAERAPWEKQKARRRCTAIRTKAMTHIYVQYDFQPAPGTLGVEMQSWQQGHAAS